MNLIRSGLVLGLVAVALGACSKDKPETQSTGSSSQGASGPARAVQETANYKASFEPVGSFKVGQPGVINVVLSTKGDYHINNEYPYKFVLQDPPAGVSYPEKIITRDKGTFEKTRGVLPVSFVPAKAGEITVTGLFSLSVCTDANCLLDKQPLTLTVKVSE